MKPDRRDGRARLDVRQEFSQAVIRRTLVFHQPSVRKVLVLRVVPTHRRPSRVKRKEPLTEMDANASHLWTSAACRA